MELGEKLRTARTDLGMTQKQLCAGIVTRNMLSQIENGSAKPSMKTLEALAGRLNKNVSFFLEETAVLSVNTEIMEKARLLFDNGEFTKAMTQLEAYREADRVYDREKKLLEQLCLLEMAKKAMRTGKIPYARALLEKYPLESVYCRQVLAKERLLLLARISGDEFREDLPEIDEELCLRSTAALNQGDVTRAAALLDACRDRTDGRWMLLRGNCYLAQKEYQMAKDCLLAAEKTAPEKAIPLLETCFRELGDYKQAYLYACKQKK